MMVVYQNEESISQLKALFDLMDKDKNGTLDAADFAVMSKNPETASFWDELKVSNCELAIAKRGGRECGREARQR